jgi:hypothetical protein
MKIRSLFLWQAQTKRKNEKHGLENMGRRDEIIDAFIARRKAAGDEEPPDTSSTRKRDAERTGRVG